MKINRKIFLLPIFLVYITNQFPLLGQTTQSLSTFVSVPPLQEIQVQCDQSFPDIFVQDIQTGYIDINQAVRLTVFSNVPWRIVVRATSENLYVSPRKFKSVNDLKWRIGAESYQSLATVPIVLAQSNEPAKNATIMIDYRLILGWKNTPPGRWEVEPEFRIEPLSGGF